MDPNNKKNISGAQFTQQSDDFQVRSSSASVGFEQSDVQPPSALYVTVDDQLQLMVSAMFNSNAVQATVRILRADGVVVPLVFQLSSTGNRQLATKSFQLIEGYLLSVALMPVFSCTLPNSCYASAQLVRTPFSASQSSMVLVSGYLNAVQPIGWPASKPQMQWEGQGNLSTTAGIFIATPGAGADWSFTVPAAMRVMVKSVSAALTTAVAVANRNVDLQIDDGANIYAMIPSGFSQLASLVDRYTWMDGAPAPVAFDSKVVIPLPASLILPAGHRISSVTTGIQAADQWGPITLMGAGWLDWA